MKTYRPYKNRILMLSVFVTGFAAGANAYGQIEEKSETAPVSVNTDGKERPTRYGIGVRARGVIIPKRTIGTFYEEVPSGVFSPGFSLDFVRINNNFELRIGVGYDGLSPKNGYWVERGDDGISNGQQPDFVDFRGLSWLTLDVTWIFHWELHKLLAFRYGGGIGAGIVLGKALQTDARCDGTDFQNDCMVDPNAEAIDEKIDIPAVLPVVTLLAGFQLRATDDLSINIEAGIRTTLFFGMSASYMF